jgi:hypothetical protein
MAILKFKRGDTITILGVRTDADGATVDLSGVTISCEMKQNQTTQAVTTAIVGGGTAGDFRLSLSAAASLNLAVGDWLCDVKFASPAIFTTDTFTIEIQERITDAS